MERRTLLKFASLAAIGATASASASAQGGETTVAMLVDVETGKTPEEALAAAKNMTAAINKAPGLLSSELLKSTIPNNNPAFVHIMKWREMKDWEAIFTNADVQKVLDENIAVLKIRPAETFTKVL